ncbi:uncharacterized protein M6B38_283415 [Iris pallida]|uniref:Uncharacterized protein n=1 Tax=Iris pallida TaxID=29817 RepID=A0AAX6I0K5_IRIPA|nr:uncharacterized protein M6B38_283415 [Iris pallida]
MSTSAQKRATQAAAAAAARSAEDNKITIGPKSSELEKDGKETGILYHGPISSTIKKVKLFFLSLDRLPLGISGTRHNIHDFS